MAAGCGGHVLPHMPYSVQHFCAEAPLQVSHASGSAHLRAGLGPRKLIAAPRRKCGRVVCNSCSPHRITIPYQYIARNPAVAFQGLPTSPTAAEGALQGYGGARVRLCNPCVPDPNTTPPRPQESPGQFFPRGHGRSQSTTSSVHLNSLQANRHGGSAPGNLSGDAHPRARSSTIVGRIPRIFVAPKARRATSCYIADTRCSTPPWAQHHRRRGRSSHPQATQVRGRHHREA